MALETQNQYCVIIPAYNAGNSISILIKKIITLLPWLKIFIINDGSNDDTEHILESYPEITIYSHNINRGKGAAIQTGIKVAKKYKYKYAVFIDADLQHPPEKIIELVDAHRKTGKDMILGVRRFFPGEMPFPRILSNTITSMIISLRTGKRVRDSQCGFRLLNIRKIKPEYYRQEGFQFESEVLIRELDRGLSFSNIIIPTIYNKSDSYINELKDTIRFVVLIFRSYCWI